MDSMQSEGDNEAGESARDRKMAAAQGRPPALAAGGVAWRRRRGEPASPLL